MARALNATGRPIVYSCSWPAYQGGLPPKVRVCLCWQVPFFPVSWRSSRWNTRSRVLHLLVYPWMVLQIPRGNGTFLPGIWGRLGVPIWLGDGSLWEEGSGVYAPHPTQMVWGWS